MSLKNNIDMVKEELNSEEKFFEKAVITEKFVKKYKNAMIGSLVAVVVLVGANIAYESNKQSKIDAANEILLELNKDSKNSALISQLKVLSPNLYDVWVLSQAIADRDLISLKELKSSKAIMVADLASYELAQDANSLDGYASKQDAIYKDLALVQSAVMLMNAKDFQKAHQELSKIGVQSPLSKIATALLHYGVK
ncbi:MAG: hypothetical protein U9Q29_02630 [Campylobacterota bacterium]|nr:hypothetical protein [Campylobacterota bacterium]